MQNVFFAKLYFLQARSYIASQLYLPTASDIARFVRSCGERGFLSLRHFVPPPSSDGGFFRREQAHRPTLSCIGFASYIAYGSYIDCVSYIALQQLYLPTASDIAHFVRSCGYSLDRNSPKVNITSAGHITHEVNITHKVHITANKKPPNEWLCLQC